MRKWSAEWIAERYAPRAARRLAQSLRQYRYTRRHWRWLFGGMDALAGRPMAFWRRLRRRRTDAIEPRSILVVQLDHLGDAVLSTVIFPLLRRRYPAAGIDVLASHWNQAIFANNPNIDGIHVSRRNWFHRVPGSRVFLREAAILGLAMRKHGYDLGIDVRGDFLVALLLWVARIPRRLGWKAGGGSFLLTDCPEWVPDRPELESRLALLAPLGILGEEPVRPELYPCAEDRAEVERKLAAAGFRAGRGGPRVVLHVGAGTEAKRWPVGHLRELVRQLTGRWGAHVILVGSRLEQRISRLVAAGFAAPQVVDWTGRLEVLELAALLERADLFVGADSGPAHVAGWAGIPAIVLFSGTNRVEQWRPAGGHVCTLHYPVTCSPCHRKWCAFPEHPCMTRITPAQVCEEIERIGFQGGKQGAGIGGGRSELPGSGLGAVPTQTGMWRLDLPERKPGAKPRKSAAAARRSAHRWKTWLFALWVLFCVGWYLRAMGTAYLRSRTETLAEPEHQDRLVMTWN